jgi:hypothetical protein
MESSCEKIFRAEILLLFTTRSLLVCEIRYTLAPNVCRHYAVPLAAMMNKFFLQQAGWSEHNTLIYRMSEHRNACC